MNREKKSQLIKINNYLILLIAPVSYELIRNIIYNILCVSFHAAYTVTVCISCIVCSVFLYFVFYRHINNELIRSRVRSKKLKCNIKMFPWVIIAGMSCCYILNAIVVISSIPANAVSSYKTVSDLIYSGEFLLVFLQIVILAPITEELLFRGIIYQCMITNVGKIIAAIISLIFFAVMHGNLLQGIYAALMTVIIICLYERFKSLNVCILFHMSANLLSFLGTKTSLLNVLFSSREIIIMNIIFTILLFVISMVKIFTNRCCVLSKNKIKK